MFGSTVLDVAIGMLFLFSLLALICSAAAEVLEALILHQRSANLRLALLQLLGPELAKHFWAHPIIKGFFQAERPPSYLPARTVALVILDLAGNSQRVSELVANAPVYLQPLLRPLARGTDDDINRFITAVETWFEHGMQRVSGWYKRHSQKVILVVALIGSALGNVDSLHIARSLYADSTLRSVAAAQADAFVSERKQTVANVAIASTQKSGSAQVLNAAGSVSGVVTGSAPPAGSSAPIASANATEGDANNANNPSAQQGSQALLKGIERLQNVDLPIGWVRAEDGAAGSRIPSGWAWAGKVFGIIISALAASLGAPFWFDLLSRLANLRTSVKPQ